MAHKYPECLPSLIRADISESDAYQLRRIAMTLHRWHELECGDGSGCIERDEETGRTYRRSSMTGGKMATADRETGALKRLAKIMARYPGMSAYVQTDPRGCALYVLRAGDIPEGQDPDCYYSRGLPVYK